MNKKQRGSLTAKGGFQNEVDICKKFKNFKKDKDAQKWLFYMGYDFLKINSLKALHIPIKLKKERAIELGILESKYDEEIKYKKSDLQIQIMIQIDGIIYTENLSLKKCNENSGFNQIDKRDVDKYQKMWNFDDKIALILKLFTGEINYSNHKDNLQIKLMKSSKRIFFNELCLENQILIKDFFTKNKLQIIMDILKGRGGLSVDWFLVTKKNKNNTFDYVLKDINEVCQFFSKGDVELTPRGSLKIGQVTMQRKGGTPDPTSLQFKINPLKLFES